MSDKIAALGGRKFLLALLSLASATVLCFTGHIADGVYSAVVLGTVGAFMTANVVQKSTSTNAPAVAKGA